MGFRSVLALVLVAFDVALKVPDYSVKERAGLGVGVPRVAVDESGIDFVRRVPVKNPPSPELAPPGVLGLGIEKDQTAEPKSDRCLDFTPNDCVQNRRSKSHLRSGGTLLRIGKIVE